jgi:hypothetical protein
MFIIFNEAVAKAMRDNPYIPPAPVDDINKPLTFISKQDNSHITLRSNGTVTNKYEYMLSAGSGVWAPYTLGTSLTLMRGDAVSFRISARNMAQDSSNYVSFTANDGVIEAWNNVQSMVDVGDYTLTVPEHGLDRLFRGCSSLIRAPKLPATTLSPSCYYAMFSSSGLSVPPELPATTLAPYCYGEMFNSCSRLTQAPALPATTLAENCYEYMFSSCGNLAQAPDLPATALARHCYDSMFSGCSRLTQTPVLPASFVPLYGYQSMFERCRALSKVIIAATSLGGYAIADWLTNVAAMGDFYCDPNTNFPTDSASGIPTGWTIHDIADYPN